MPYGFSGKASKGYLAGVHESLSESNVEYTKDPFEGYSWSVGTPSLPYRSSQETPYPPDSASGGGHSTGLGNSGNIAVSEDTFVEISGRVNRIDEDMCRDIQTVILEIEEMCNTVFILEQTLPKYLGILNSVKSSLGEFESLTTDSETQARKFAGEISDIC
jgi:hypothetical protein